jgi:hypothetical protein
MSKNYHTRRAIYAIVAGFFILLAVGRSQPPWPNMFTPHHAIGQLTNGIAASLDADDRKGYPPIIEAFVINTNAGGFWGGPEPDERPVLEWARKVFSDELLYFPPTNSFCGPIELCDASGKKLPSLKPEASSLDAYPAAFSFAFAKKHNPDPRIHFPRALSSSPERLNRFSVWDYFAITNAGEYRLTVWPKIYHRSSTNDDLCQRIDIPPVTITLKLYASPLKSEN